MPNPPPIPSGFYRDCLQYHWIWIVQRNLAVHCVTHRSEQIFKVQRGLCEQGWGMVTSLLLLGVGFRCSVKITASQEMLCGEPIHRPRKNGQELYFLQTGWADWVNVPAADKNILYITGLMYINTKSLTLFKCLVPKYFLYIYVWRVLCKYVFAQKIIISESYTD